jgi:CoA:oxalate CoA-transferase
VVQLNHPAGKHTFGPGNPIKLSRTGDESFSEAPLLGQHTAAVLAEVLHLADDDIDDLFRAGVIR